jgi:Gram-negative bacterial TonB protein C-terminal
MKKKYLPLLSVLYFYFAFTLNASAQLDTNDDNTIYNSTSVEKVAEFPGGMQAFYNYIGENFVLPTNQEFKGGKIITSFVIEKDGSVADIKVLRDIGFATDDETIRVLKACPLWNPAEQNGKKVRVQFMLPINLQPPPVDNNKVYDIDEVQIKPEYSGGTNKFSDYIKKNYTAPRIPGLKGKVFVKFTVDTDGSIINIKVLRDIGYGSGDEAVRVLKSCPKWTPARKDGNAVQCTYFLPIIVETPVETKENSNSLQRKR